MRLKMGLKILFFGYFHDSLFVGNNYLETENFNEISLRAKFNNYCMPLLTKGL